MDTIIKGINDTINYISSSVPSNPNYPVKIKEHVKPFKTTTLNVNKQAFPSAKKSKINLPLKNVKKLNIELEYESHRNLGLADSGYYLDLTEPPIGNRPVYKDYSKHSTIHLMKDNYKDGNFSCNQPIWSENCF